MSLKLTVKAPENVTGPLAVIVTSAKAAGLEIACERRPASVVIVTVRPVPLPLVTVGRPTIPLLTGPVAGSATWAADWAVVVTFELDVTTLEVLDGAGELLPPAQPESRKASATKGPRNRANAIGPYPFAPAIDHTCITRYNTCLCPSVDNADPRNVNGDSLDRCAHFRHSAPPAPSKTSPRSPLLADAL